MNVRDDRREAAIERMADHVLAQGLAAATLRPLAAAAGTSDRMLLYYFADKDELLAATLGRIAARMVAQLDGAIPVEPRRPFPVLLEQVWAAMASERLVPFMPLWLDLAAGAARGRQPHRDVAGAIADGFLASAWSRTALAGRRRWRRCSSRRSRGCTSSRPSAEVPSRARRSMSLPRGPSVGRQPAGPQAVARRRWPTVPPRRAPRPTWPLPSRETAPAACPWRAAAMPAGRRRSPRADELGRAGAAMAMARPSLAPRRERPSRRPP